MALTLTLWKLQNFTATILLQKFCQITFLHCVSHIFQSKQTCTKSISRNILKLIREVDLTKKNHFDTLRSLTWPPPGYSRPPQVPPSIPSSPPTGLFYPLRSPSNPSGPSLTPLGHPSGSTSTLLKSTLTSIDHHWPLLTSSGPKSSSRHSGRPSFETHTYETHMRLIWDSFWS